MPDARTFAALAHELRLAIFRLLVSHAPDGLPAGQIALRLQVPASTLSGHLTQLEHAGLLRSRRERQRIVYAIDAEGTRGLVDYLVRDCCEGQPELCGLPRAGERAKPSRSARGSRPQK